MNLSYADIDQARDLIGELAVAGDLWIEEWMPVLPPPGVPWRQGDDVDVAASMRRWWAKDRAVRAPGREESLVRRQLAQVLRIPLAGG